LSEALNISDNKVAVDMAAMRPVGLAEFNVTARGINTNCISRSQQLSKVINATTSATSGLK
jgi:hypothetical protein